MFKSHAYFLTLLNMTRPAGKGKQRKARIVILIIYET